jgi:[CysO sulfur-carrier protein]-S-L-cysteine hydrolase
MLRLPSPHRQAMIDHAVRDLPNEACGLVAGPPRFHAVGGDVVEEVYPCGNDDASPIVYTLNSLDHLRADRDAESKGREIVGVYHSHTHTEAYPSPTDVGKAPDPGWHYILVSLKYDPPVVRSFRIVDGAITEEEVVIEDA